MTENEKNLLKSLTEHAGWSVLLRLEEEARKQLGELLLSVNVEDSKQLAVIRENQIYCKARRDFIENINSQIGTIYEAPLYNGEE